MIKAWEKASKELGIKIQTSFTLTIDGDELNCYLLIEEFGSKKGTVIMSTDDMVDFNKPGKLGYYCSALNPLNYSSYNRDRFVDTLTDWGFYGDKDNVPSWYEGHIYKE